MYDQRWFSVSHRALFKVHFMNQGSPHKSPMSRRGKNQSSEKVTPPKKRSQNIYDYDGMISSSHQVEIKTSLTLPALPSTENSLSVGEWFNFASCKGQTVKFFRHTCSLRCNTHPQGCDRVATVRHCRNICLTCPVLEHCRIWAISTNLIYGFAGGMSESERETFKTMLEEENGRIPVQSD